MNLGPEGLILGLKLNFVTQFTYVFALAFAKVRIQVRAMVVHADVVQISIGLFLIRLTPPASIYRKLLWMMIGFVAVYTVSLSAALLSSCKPFAANFDRTIPGHKCWDPKTAQAFAFTNQCELERGHNVRVEIDDNSFGNYNRLGSGSNPNSTSLEAPSQSTSKDGHFWNLVLGSFRFFGICGQAVLPDFVWSFW